MTSDTTNYQCPNCHGVISRRLDPRIYEGFTKDNRMAYRCLHCSSWNWGLAHISHEHHCPFRIGQESFGVKAVEFYMKGRQIDQAMGGADTRKDSSQSTSAIKTGTKTGADTPQPDHAKDRCGDCGHYRSNHLYNVPTGYSCAVACDCSGWAEPSPQKPNLRS